MTRPDRYRGQPGPATGEDAPRAVRAGKLSLRLRLTVVFAAAMTVVLVAVGTLVYLSAGADLLQAVDRDLGVRADAVTADLAADPRRALASDNRFIDPDEAFAQVLAPGGRIVAATSGVGSVPLVPPARLARVVHPTYFTRAATALDDAQRVFAVPVEIGGEPRFVVVGSTLGDRQDALDHLLVVLLVAGGLAVVLTSLGGWLLAGAALRPVERMRLRAAELAAGRRHGELPVPDTGDELSRLGATLNSLLTSERAAVQREVRFVDEASHELRTPLAVLKAELDLSRSHPRSPDELDETLRAASRETDRLCRLTEDLLVLARSRQDGPGLRREPVQLDHLVRSAVAPMTHLELASGRAITIDAPETVVQLDAGRVQQAVYNLTDNAIRHGAGTVTIRVRVGADAVEVVVCDQGEGFPAALRETAFEPFQRGPIARSDQPGGLGLGLSIVEAVATAHGESATICTTGEGRGVRLVLPLLG